MDTCLFCERNFELVLENNLAVAFYDKFPVSKGHLLIIPKRHAKDYFELNSMEKQAIDALILEAKQVLDELYSPDGYNIGANIGLAAGQTIFHCHIHLIPRYNGDIADPTGGVRGVIPDKRVY